MLFLSLLFLLHSSSLLLSSFYSPYFTSFPSIFSYSFTPFSSHCIIFSVILYLSFSLYCSASQVAVKSWILAIRGSTVGLVSRLKIGSSAAIRDFHLYYVYNGSQGEGPALSSGRFTLCTHWIGGRAGRLLFCRLLQSTSLAGWPSNCGSQPRPGCSLVTVPTELLWLLSCCVVLCCVVFRGIIWYVGQRNGDEDQGATVSKGTEMGVRVGIGKWS